MTQPGPIESPDDIVAVDRGETGRKLEGLAGRGAVDSWRDADGSVRQFDCRLLKITPNTIELTAPFRGSVGDWVVVYFDRLGRFEGPIVQPRKVSFVMRIVATNDDRAQLASTIAWAAGDKPDARRFPRTVPEYQESMLSVSATRVLPCLVQNHSICGASVVVALTPPIGAVVKVGQVVARVVRHFSGGFAVEFASLQDPERIKELIVEPAPTAAKASPLKKRV